MFHGIYFKVKEVGVLIVNKVNFTNHSLTRTNVQLYWHYIESVLGRFLLPASYSHVLWGKQISIVAQSDFRSSHDVENPGGEYFDKKLNN